MLEAQPKQFRLKDDGAILFQPDATNPLPGEPIARAVRGVSLLDPGVEMLDADILRMTDKDAARDKVESWLKSHIETVLEPLVALQNEEGMSEPVQIIAGRVFEALGIIPRGDVEEAIAKLDPEGRKLLRDRNIRLGPILIFMPALNKPAAIHLRAVLWTLWRGGALPPLLPADGMVSMPIEGKGVIDPLFFRAIGYPVYGPRAVRIDMLDRVVNAVYDSAKDGVFAARHEMAEWLGCPISDLYAVLEAMGHKKIEEAPAPAPVAETPPVEAAAVAEPVATETAPVEEKPAGETPVAAAPAPAPAKPVLARFRLRRGKAYGGGQRPERPARKPRAEGESKPEGDKVKKFGKKHGDKKDRGERKKKEEQPRSYSAAAPAPRPEDSPFAALQNLKIKSGGGS